MSNQTQQTQADVVERILKIVPRNKAGKIEKAFLRHIETITVFRFEIETLLVIEKRLQIAANSFWAKKASPADKKKEAA